MTEIRLARHEDIEDILNLSFEFFEDSISAYGLRVSRETLKKTIAMFIDKHVAIVAVVNNKVVGAIGGIVNKSIFDETQIIAQEIMWFLNKEYRKGKIGIRLLDAFEDVCRDMGVHILSMICMSNSYNEVLNVFYKKRGYILTETHYSKEL